MIWISILLYIISPFLSLPITLAGIILDKKHRIVYLIMLAFTLSILSYYIVPNKSLDLYRYFLIIDSYKNKSIIEFLQMMLQKNEPAFQTIFYIISKIGDNSWLSFSCTLFSYSTIFYIINDYAKKIELNNIYVFFTILFFVITYNYVYLASGIRFAVAVIVFIFAIYLEYVKGKNKIWYKALYILPFFLHKSLFIAIIFRILMSFNYKKLKEVYILIAVMIFIIPDVLIMFSRVLSIIPIFSVIYEKMVIYMQLDSNKTIFTSGPINLLYFATAAYLIIIYLYNKFKLKKEVDLNQESDTKKENENDNNDEKINSKLYDIIELFSIFLLGVIRYVTLFTRFSMIIRILGIIPLMDWLKLEKNKINKLFTLLVGLEIMSISAVGQYATLKSISFGKLFHDKKIVQNIFSLMIK